MSLKAMVKRAMVGPPGNSPHEVKRGLLKGLRFNVDPSTKSMRLLGLDEREITAPVKRLAALAVTALDIGANDGWYSLYFASRPNIKTVYAFEPSTDLKPSLHDNFALNDPAFSSKLKFVSKMVGDHTDEKWCSIDELVPNLELPAILKVDVDGGEMDVFRGAAKTLAKDGCMVILETHSAELEQQCQKFLNDLRYKTTIVKNGWYRAFVPEGRVIEHNRWMIATR